MIIHYTSTMHKLHVYIHVFTTCYWLQNIYLMLLWLLLLSNSLVVDHKRYKKNYHGSVVVVTCSVYVYFIVICNEYLITFSESTNYELCAAHNRIYDNQIVWIMNIKFISFLNSYRTCKNRINNSFGWNIKCLWNEYIAKKTR